MRKRWCWLLIGLLLLAGCSTGQTPLSPSPSPSATALSPPRSLTTAESQLVQSDNSFGFRLFQELNKASSTESIFISPTSIAMALGMTINGATGTTYEAMKNTLELKGFTDKEINESYQGLIGLLPGLDPQVAALIANSIWYRQGLPVAREFIDPNQQYFSAAVRELNFADPNAAKTINDWVSKNTIGKITKIVPDTISPEMVMYLISAIYFKGMWTDKFDPNETRDDTFVLSDGSRKPCKMMVNHGKFKYFENDRFQAVDLSYGNESYGMAIFLPKAQAGIDALISQLDQKNWQSWVASFSKREGDIYLPKFKLEYEKTLNDLLKALGMAVAFNSDEADFSRIANVSPERLYISEVKYKSFVEVDEEGTEAAAVTSVGVALTSAPVGNFVMRVDHPFLFVIHENHSQTILFLGKVLQV